MSPRIPNVKFRNLQKDEIPQILQLMAKEGRQMGRESELKTWFEIDSNGFFVAEDDGEIVGSCVGIRLSAYHGNIGMFVVKENYRGCGIGTKIWELAINHLGQERNKGLSAVQKLFHIYRDKANFNKVSNWDVVLFKLDGRKLLANLANFLKAKPTRNGGFLLQNNAHSSENLLENLNFSDKNCSQDQSNSGDLNSIFENEELKPHFTRNKGLRNSFSSPVQEATHYLWEANEQQERPFIFLKDITHEDNLVSKDWIRKKKSNSSLNKDTKFPTFNQLIYYSTPKPHQLITPKNKVFQNNSKPNSASISLPSLLNSDSLNVFDKSIGKTNSSLFKPENIGSSNSLINSSSYINIVPYSKYWLNKLIEYDEQLNGYNRSKIVELSVNEEDSKTKLAIINEKIVGYSTVKYSLQDTYLIAPLYANSQLIANDLIKEFVRSMTIPQLAKGLVLKLPNCNKKAIELMKNLGFEKQNYLVTRCFTDYVHKTATQRIFAMQSTIFSSE